MYSETGFPGSSVVKNPPANTGDKSPIPGSGRSPGGGHGNPFQYFCLENPMDRGASKSRTRLSTWAHVHAFTKRWLLFKNRRHLSAGDGIQGDFTEETEMRGSPWRVEDTECGMSKQHKDRRTEEYSSNRWEQYREKWTRDFQEWKAGKIWRAEASTHLFIYFFNTSF